VTQEPTEKTPQQQIDELKQANAALASERDGHKKKVADLEKKVATAGSEFERLSSAATAAKDAVGAGARNDEPKHRKTIAVAICLVQVGIGWILSGPLASQLRAENLPFQEYGGQAALLAYCVSLSAYLANVRRDAVKSLASKTGDERQQRKWEAILVTGGEQALVVIGLLAAARIATLLPSKPWVDALLITLVLVNVLYLAAVHFVEWFGPFKKA
jgi:hypothetical protein